MTTKSAYASSYWLIALAGLLWGMITVEGKLLASFGLSPFEAALYTQLGWLFTVPYILYKKLYMDVFRHWKFFVVYGIIQGTLQFFQVGGSALGAPVAIVAFLLYTNPIYTTVIGWIFLKEIITRRKLAAIAIGILGVLVMLEPWKGIQGSSPVGIAFGVLGGVFLALWIIYGRIGGLKHHRPVTLYLGQGMYAFFWMLVYMPFARILLPNAVHLSSASLAYLPLTLLLSACSLLGVLAFYKGVQNVSASTASIILLLEPISAVIIAAVAFGQGLHMNTVAGGFLVLLSNYLVVTGT